MVSALNGLNSYGFLFFGLQLCFQIGSCVAEHQLQTVFLVDLRCAGIIVDRNDIDIGIAIFKHKYYTFGYTCIVVVTNQGILPVGNVLRFAMGFDIRNHIHTEFV